MRSTLGLISVLAFVLASCGSEAPTLPSQDTMTLPAFGNSTQGGLSLAGSNFTLAAGSVLVVSVAVDWALIAPKVIWAAVVQEHPQYKDGDWQWSHDFPILGYQATLHAKLDQKLKTSMHVTGTYKDIPLNDYVWYDGEHSANNGYWEFFDPERPNGAFLRIDWSVVSDTDKDLSFTNVYTSLPEYNDSIAYSLKATTASMAIHDSHSGDHGTNHDANSSTAASDFSVQWDTATGAGKMTANGTSYCWDAAKANIACP